MSKKEENNNQISIPVWWITNGHWIRRSALEWNHPESEYNYIKTQLKLRPEDYGVYKNMEDMLELQGKSKRQLIDEVITLREQIRAIERAGF